MEKTIPTDTNGEEQKKRRFLRKAPIVWVITVVSFALSVVALVTAFIAVVYVQVA